MLLHPRRERGRHYLAPDRESEKRLCDPGAHGGPETRAVSGALVCKHPYRKEYGWGDSRPAPPASGPGVSVRRESRLEESPTVTVESGRGERATRPCDMRPARCRRTHGDVGPVVSRSTLRRCAPVLLLGPLTLAAFALGAVETLAVHLALGLTSGPSTHEGSGDLTLWHILLSLVLENSARRLDTSTLFLWWENQGLRRSRLRISPFM